MQGFVRKLFADKGYAFIEGSDQRDYFLHWSKVSRASVPFRNMREGDKVTFDYEEGDQGPKALNVLVNRTQENTDATVRPLANEAG
jgi:CspA family cold shock protein